MLINRLCVTLGALGALAITARAQPSAGVSGPVTGFVFVGPAGAIRPMLGIPGAAYLGGPVATGLVAASIAPDGSAALAVQQAGKLVLYTGLRTGAPVATAVPGGIAGADHFAWAGDSSGAAVYSAASGQGQILSGLGKSPAAGSPIDLAGIAGQVTALACDGQRLIVGVSGDSGGIYVAGGSSGAQRILHPPMKLLQTGRCGGEAPHGSANEGASEAFGGGAGHVREATGAVGNAVPPRLRSNGSICHRPNKWGQR